MAEDIDSAKRRKRIQRLKKAILVTIITAIVVPLLAAILFLCMFLKTRARLNELQLQYDDLISSMEQLKDDIEYEAPDADVYLSSEVVESTRDATEDYVDVVDYYDDSDNEFQQSTEAKRLVYLTFDDGPSSNTDRILDILKEYDVKATFFVTGKTDETSVAAYKRIVEEGHTLGMHSYSHKYSQVYASEEAFAEDLKTLQEYLYDTTGVWSRYYRFPGGSSNTASSVDMNQLIKYLNDQDITYYDWNVVSGDATGYYVSADKIYENCVSKLDKFETAYILMHDAAAKNNTVEALPRIIETIQGMEDTVIVPIDDSTVPVQHRTFIDN